MNLTRAPVQVRAAPLQIFDSLGRSLRLIIQAHIAQTVEHLALTQKVAGSIPVMHTKKPGCPLDRPENFELEHSAGCTVSADDRFAVRAFAGLTRLTTKSRSAGPQDRNIVPAPPLERSKPFSPWDLIGFRGFFFALRRGSQYPGLR